MKKVLPFIFLLVVLIPTYALAANVVEFVPLSPKIPLINSGNVGTMGLGNLINAFFAIAIVISAVLAVIMVAIGGFKYMATDSVFQMGNAKEQISNAIFGLLIVLTAILVLTEINPNIIKLRLFNPLCYTSSPPAECFAPGT